MSQTVQQADNLYANGDYAKAIEFLSAVIEVSRIAGFNRDTKI
jgi:hypothetical protein